AVPGPRGDVDRAGGVELVGTSRGGRWIFDRNVGVDLSAEPDGDDHPLPVSGDLAAVAGGVLWMAAAPDARRRVAVRAVHLPAPGRHRRGDEAVAGARLSRRLV